MFLLKQVHRTVDKKIYPSEKLCCTIFLHSKSIHYQTYTIRYTISNSRKPKKSIKAEKKYTITPLALTENSHLTSFIFTKHERISQFIDPAQFWSSCASCRYMYQVSWRIIHVSERASARQCVHSRYHLTHARACSTRRSTTRPPLLLRPSGDPIPAVTTGVSQFLPLRHSRLLTAPHVVPTLHDTLFYHRHVVPHPLRLDVTRSLTILCSRHWP